MPMEFDPYPDFSRVIGPSEAYATPSEADLAEAQRRVSESFAHLLRHDGVATYLDGKLRTVLPQDMSSLAELWPLDGNVGEIFMTTCFGDFFCWASGFCWFVSVQELYAAELVDSVEWFLGSLLPDKKYLKSRFEGVGKGRKVLAKHELQPTEMLQWVPALPLGGSREDSSVEIMALREGHELLAQMGELRLIRY
jgi:hypothetical protein